MKRVFLVHGWDGTPDNHWFPWLTSELTKRGFSVFAPAMPNATYPKVSEWISALSLAVGQPDEDTYFVGHSLGSVTIVRYLASLQKEIVTGGCVFVGGFLTELDWAKKIEEFWSLPLDVERAKARARAFVSIASDNDDSVPTEKSRELALRLGGKFILEKGKGHFCADDGVTELPSVLEAILTFSGYTP